MYKNVFFFMFNVFTVMALSRVGYVLRDASPMRNVMIVAHIIEIIDT